MLARQIKNSVCFAGGLAALALVSAKHRVIGYSTPTGFASSDWHKSADHVISIVNDYRKHANMNGRRFGFEGARVLELGPGLTLGTGVLLAGLGITSYFAIDAFPLAQSTAPEFYKLLAEGPLPTGFDRLKVAAAAHSVIEGDARLIGYSHDPRFDVPKLVADRRFDLIVSNAAFEHFDAVDKIVAAISGCAAPGALFMAMIDFQTHSRFVRTADPNNIYRFSPRIYRALHFPGQPNRWRPRDYVRDLAQNGWMNVAVRSVETAPPDYCAWTHEGLAAEFQSNDCDMDVLTGVVVADRPPA
jgi:SAM-dependent methyltransferase